MKTFSSIVAALLMSLTIFAQNNSLVVYSQDGLRFTLILNGVRQNAQPETNVKVSGINSPTVQAKLIFDNQSGEMNQNLYFMEGGEHSQNMEFNYGLANKGGKYKLQFKGASALTAATGQTAYAEKNDIYQPAPSSSETITTTTVVTGVPVLTTTMNVPGVGVNISIDGVSSHTTTTTTSTGSYSSGSNNVYVLPGYNGAYGCPYPMSDTEFQDAKRSIEAKSFDESRLTVAKQIIGSNCLLSSQIRQLMELMSFESSRLDLAKFAWHHNLDKGNYYKLNDAFTFETSIDELNKYTQSH